MSHSKIFISHSHADDPFAERLVRDLRAAGADAWLDKIELGAGSFQQHINEALLACDWFLLTLTHSALVSRWVQHEVEAATSLKHQGQIRDLIFVQAEPVEYSELPPLWRTFNIIDATADYALMFERLMGVLKVEDRSPYTPPPVARGSNGIGDTIPQQSRPVVPVTTRETLFGMVSGVVCPRCSAFNSLEDVERLVDQSNYATTLWGSLPARCGRCGNTFYYMPPSGD